MKCDFESSFIAIAECIQQITEESSRSIPFINRGMGKDRTENIVEAGPGSQ